MDSFCITHNFKLLDSLSNLQKIILSYYSKYVLSNNNGDVILSQKILNYLGEYKELLDIKKIPGDINYININIRKQLYNIFNQNGKPRYFLINMLTKSFGNYNWNNYFMRELKTDDDQKIMSSLRPFAKRSVGGSISRAEYRVTTLKPLILENELKKINKEYKEYKYLDIGAADGSITYAIGKYLRLSKENIIGADVSNNSQYKLDNDSKLISENITRVIINESGKLPFEDKSINLITLFMVMHHIKEDELINRLLEIKRILKNKGILVIREHDCITNSTRMLCDIEHEIYDVGLAEKEDKDFYNKYYAIYRSKIQWTNILNKLGFKYINGDKIVNDTATRGYHDVFIKD